MFIENVLGSKAKVKILRVLGEVRTAYSLKGLVKETGLSLSITHQAAEELAEEKVVTKIKGTGKERLYKFNAESGFAAAIFDLFKTEKTRQRKEVVLLKVWNVLEQLVTKIKGKVMLVLLYGSHARGDAALNSDIDVLIIPKKKVDAGLVKSVEKNIHPLILEVSTFKEGIKNKSPLYQNLRKDSIILFKSKEAKSLLKEFINDLEQFIPGESKLGEGKLK